VTDFNLFALTRDPERRILRIPLSKDVQAEVTELFKQQEADFRASAQEDIPFDGKYKPDSGECLVIADFSDIDGLSEAVKNPLSYAEIKPSAIEFSTIKALFSGFENSDGVYIVLVQYFDKRKIISNAGISLFHSENVYRKVDGVGITIDGELAAVLDGTNLKFFSFSKARQIFDLTAHYNEATDADIAAFAAMPVIHAPTAAALVAMADSWVRRKLSFITQSQILQTVPAEAIAKAAAPFNILVKTTEIDGKQVVMLPDNKTELKKLLRFLDEDYYHSALVGDHYLSNSKRRVKAAGP
jgi:hypothetical protein